ncbi:MAG: beta-aspartyl-peptidase, partial [Atribacterota bacterium]|nr:beta-aspartyl-peptidase [Atribacterota bacterium]
MLKVIKNGHIYSPEDIGSKDILIAGEKIIDIRENISIPNDFPVEIINAKDKLVVPGFIDGHVHILGGGGSEGPSSHTHDVGFSSLAMSGITTLVGTLGLDDIYFDIKRLLVKAKALEEDGLSSYIYTGSFKYPGPT